VGTNVSEEHTVSVFNPEDGSSMFLRNVGTHIRVHTASQPRIPTSSQACFTKCRVYHNNKSRNNSIIKVADTDWEGSARFPEEALIFFSRHHHRAGSCSGKASGNYPEVPVLMLVCEPTNLAVV
jgi:hypothetical protein